MHLFVVTSYYKTIVWTRKTLMSLGYYEQREEDGVVCLCTVGVK
jgi:hypothetical protein